MSQAIPVRVPVSRGVMIAGVIAAVGALLTGIGEFFMLYSPNGGYGMANLHANFLARPLAQVREGFFLGTLSAPIYVLGYWHVSQVIAADLPRLRWIILGLAVYGFVVGNVWLGTNAYIAHIVHLHAASSGAAADNALQLLRDVDFMSEPLLQVVRVAVLALSVIFILRVARGRTIYPRAMVLVTPVLLMAVIFVLFVVVPSVGGYLLPAALNVAHFIFFLTSILVLRRHAA